MKTGIDIRLSHEGSSGGSVVRGRVTGGRERSARCPCSENTDTLEVLTEMQSTRSIPHRPIDFQISLNSPSSTTVLTPNAAPASTPTRPSTCNLIPSACEMLRTSILSGPRTTRRIGRERRVLLWMRRSGRNRRGERERQKEQHRRIAKRGRLKRVWRARVCWV